MKPAIMDLSSSYFSGGSSPYDISWTGGSAMNVTSPYNIVAVWQLVIIPLRLQMRNGSILQMQSG